jgi:hypothetical protein
MSDSEHLVDDLVAYAEGLGLASEDLDDVVYDHVSEGAASAANQVTDEEAEDALDQEFARGSAINNGGLPEQLRFLYEQTGCVERVRAEIRRAAGRPDQGSGQP